jgi:hypothetical protein
MLFGVAQGTTLTPLHAPIRGPVWLPEHSMESSLARRLLAY